jgi:C1A family cysteine protease
MDTAIALGKIQSDNINKQHQTRKTWLLVLAILSIILIGLVICFSILWLQNTGAINRTTNCQSDLITYEQISAIDSLDVIPDQSLVNEGVYSTGGKQYDTSNIENVTGLDMSIELPKQFYWKRCELVPVNHQRETSTCTSFSVLQMLAARYGILKNEIPEMLSVQQILDCYPHDAFIGIDTPSILSFTNTHPIVLAENYPFIYKNNPSCQEYLVNQSVRILSSKPYKFANADEIKRDIYENGPVCAVIRINQDFDNYSATYNNDIVTYTPNPSSPSKGLHTINVIGWLELSNNQNVWICINSWGRDWPLNPWNKLSGVFFIAFNGDIEASSLGANVIETVV